MKVLVTNHSLTNIGGSETFTYTFVEELKRRYSDGDIHVYSPTLGLVAEKIRELGVRVSSELDSGYDVIFSSHNNTLKRIINKKVSGKKIHTIHGTISNLEKFIHGADEYVSVSEEVKDSLPVASHVIYNGVNLDRFRDNKPNDTIKVVGCLSQGSLARTLIKNLCVKNRYQFVDVPKNRNIWNVEDHLFRCDIVFTLGRGAIESLACGKNVFVFDSRGYMKPYSDGIIKMSNYKDLMSHNFSGRYSKKIIKNINDIESELVNYNANNHIYYRNIARRHFDIKKQVQKYIDLI